MWVWEMQGIDVVKLGGCSCDTRESKEEGKKMKERRRESKGNERKGN